LLKYKYPIFTTVKTMPTIQLKLSIHFSVILADILSTIISKNNIKREIKAPIIRF